MSYAAWLAALSLAFVVIERLGPRHDQRILRRGILTDLVYLVVNGHFLGVGLAVASEPLVAWLDGWLGSVGLRDWLYLGAASDLPGWAQFAIAFLAIDLLHWSIHNLLHRVPFLWELHKVHHSVETMDWIASLRFHWGEVVIYKSLSYLPLAFLGFDGEVLFVLAVVSTAIGHFNHANLRLSIGPVKYVLNSPEMHVWHHVRPDGPAPPMWNFAINLALWDWLFGTAHLPDHPPERLGFEGIESFPRTFAGQVVHPLPAERAVRGMLRRD